MSFHYFLFGFGFTSNVELPGFPPNRNRGSSWCELHLGAEPHLETFNQNRQLIYTSAFKDKFGEPALKMWSIDDQALFELTYSDGHRFWFDRQTANVWALWPPSSCLEEATSYLLGPVLGILLRYRSVVCLHASSVAVDGQAVAFVGPPGAGKSTTATALARRGYKVLADDITAIAEIDGVFRGFPAHPGVWLWPDSIGTLYDKSVYKPRVTRLDDKTRLSTKDGLEFEPNPLPLGRIYVLNSGHSRIASSPQQSFLSLVANTYATNVLTAEMRGQEFTTLTKLISQVPVRHVSWPGGLDRLKEFCDGVLNDAVLK